MGIDGSMGGIEETIEVFSGSLLALGLIGEDVSRTWDALTWRFICGVRSVSGVGTDIRESIVGLGSVIGTAIGFGGSSLTSTIGGGCDRGIVDVGGYEGGPRGAMRVYTCAVSFRA